MRTLKLLLAFSSIAVCATLASADVQRHRLRQHTAVVNYSPDYDRCVLNSIYVLVTSGVEQFSESPKEDVYRLEFHLFSEDQCSASNDFFFVSSATNIDPRDITFAKDLSSARLRTDLEVDDGSGVPRTLHIDIRWFATSPREKVNFHDQVWWSPTEMIKERGHGTFRDARVVGSITDGNREFVTTRPEQASITFFHGGEMLVQKLRRGKEK